MKSFCFVKYIYVISFICGCFFSNLNADFFSLDSLECDSKFYLQYNNDFEYHSDDFREDYYTKIYSGSLRVKLHKPFSFESVEDIDNLEHKFFNRKYKTPNSLFDFYNKHKIFVINLKNKFDFKIKVNLIDFFSDDLNIEIKNNDYPLRKKRAFIPRAIMALTGLTSMFSLATLIYYFILKDLKNSFKFFHISFFSSLLSAVEYFIFDFIKIDGVFGENFYFDLLEVKKHVEYKKKFKIKPMQDLYLFFFIENDLEKEGFFLDLIKRNIRKININI